MGSRFVEISKLKNELHSPKEIEMDILNSFQVKAIVNSFDFGTIVNFAAYTNVNEAEEQRGSKDGDCWKVNVEGVRNLVDAVKNSNKKMRFVQISTDNVFSGGDDDPGPYSEDHKPETDQSKVTWYGFTKKKAEEIALGLGENASVLRITYPVRVEFGAKLDYLRKSLKLFDEGKLYPLFDNQMLSTTFIDEACRALDMIITKGHGEIFHAASSDTTTPYELITYMLKMTGRETGSVKKVKLEEFLTKTGHSPVRYPKFGGLKVEKTEKELGMKFSTWKQVVQKLVAQGLGKKD